MHVVGRWYVRSRAEIFVFKQFYFRFCTQKNTTKRHQTQNQIISAIKACVDKDKSAS